MDQARILASRTALVQTEIDRTDTVQLGAETVRILHLTDTHIGLRAWYDGAPHEWSRATDHLDAMRTALAPAMAEDVDLVVHTGDLFDRSRPQRAAAQAAVELLVATAARVPTLLMPGNHDRRGLRRHLPLRAPGLTVVDAPTQVRMGEVALAVVPFMRRARDWQRAAKAAWSGGADLLLAHQAFHGARVPGMTFREGAQPDTIGARHLPPGARHILCGHIHPRQVTRLGDAFIVQPGATERTAFSEASQTKGYAIWTLGKSVSWRFVDLPSRPMLRVDAPADLSRLHPGTLVRLSRNVDNTTLLREAMARGAWVRARVTRPSTRPATPQVALF